MTTSTADRVLAALAHYDLKAEGPNKYRSNSPLRPGSNSHAFCLLISGPEYGAYRDWVSGDEGSLYKLAEALGVERAKRATPAKRELVATYDYVGEDGALLYQACRYEPGKDGKAKDFMQRRPDGNGGWEWNMQSVQKVLYCLPDVRRAVAAGETIYIVEGEKDADRLRLYGLVATTNVGGAEAKWLKAYTEALKGARVVVLRDNDEPGEKHRNDVVRSLLPVAASVKAPDLPDLKPKGDVSDWLDAGHTFAELRALVDTALPVTAPAAAVAANDEPARATDLGNARRLVRQFGDRIRYVHTWGAWLVWDGARWVKDETGEIHRLARETVKTMYAEAAKVEDPDIRKALGKWATQSESAGKLGAMVDLAESEPGIAVHHTALDADPWLLNCKNGTIDLHTGTLRPHNRTDLLTKLVDVAYDADAAAPTWAKFLERITSGDAALADYMRRAAGYTLTGDTTEQCLFFCYGTGANGKSTFVETLSDLLSNYWLKAPAEMLMQQRNGGGIPNDIARLPGARMVVASEVSEGRRLDEGKVKDLTGGDTLVARFMKQEFFEFRPVFKLWMYGNYKPVIRGTDNGIWRRIRLIPFTTTIPDEEKDPTLPKKLRAELPGILAWAVRGCLEWQRDGLTPPAVVKDATEAYRNEMDVIGAFLDERCILRPGARVAIADLYKAYVAWCEAAGEHYLTQKQFGQRLDLRGLESKRTNKAFVRLGVALLEADQQELSVESDPVIHGDPKSHIRVSTSFSVGEGENRITTDHGSLVLSQDEESKDDTTQPPDEPPPGVTVRYSTASRKWDAWRGYSHVCQADTEAEAIALAWAHYEAAQRPAAD